MFYTLPMLKLDISLFLYSILSSFIQSIPLSLYFPFHFFLNLSLLTGDPLAVTFITSFTGSEDIREIALLTDESFSIISAGKSIWMRICFAHIDVCLAISSDTYGRKNWRWHQTMSSVCVCVCVWLKPYANKSHELLQFISVHAALQLGLQNVVSYNIESLNSDFFFLALASLYLVLTSL